MADNTDEEHLDKPTTNQSENPPDKITPTNYTETINTNKESETMEVHHHANHEGKKNWKSYLWEFLMLFLAVFCGFLAEYQLEHTIEHQREREYINSMITDLKIDTAQMTEVLKNNNESLPYIDKLALVCFKKSIDTNDIRNMYKYFSAGANHWQPMKFQDITISQLKNAGAMRLIRNKRARDSILRYDKAVEEIKSVETNYRHYYLESISLARKIFNMKYTRIDTKTGLEAPFDISSMSELITNNQALINEYGNAIEKLKATIIDFVSQLEKSQGRSEKLIFILQKEYDIN